MDHNVLGMWDDVKEEPFGEVINRYSGFGKELFLLMRDRLSYNNYKVTTSSAVFSLLLSQVLSPDSKKRP